MSEIVATLPGYAVQWEPFHLKNNPHCKDFGFTWQNYIPPGTQAEAKRAYLEDILTGRDLSTRTTSTLAFDLSRFRELRGFVVKMVNANMMLAWILEQVPVRTVFMVRHPCAVVASQMAHQGWAGLRKDQLTLSKGLVVDYPEYKAVFESISEPEELLAFEWALQAHIPLSTPRPHPWHFTTYEWMVERGREEVDRLFAYLGEPVPEAAYSQLRVASATTASESNVSQGRNPLEGWRRTLTEVQISRILSVTHRMGADYYGEDLVPNSEALARMGMSLSTP